MEYLSEEISEIIRKEIEKAGGNEVFFVGTVDGETGKVCDVKVCSRGNRYSVPAIIERASYSQVVIHNHPSGNLSPSQKDIEIASILGNKGVGFFIVNNHVSDVYVVVEPFWEKSYHKLDLNELKELFLPGGPISKELGSRYECRKEQIDVMSCFAEAFNENLLALVEAGTGTGKTFSYLVPSILWAIRNEERVVISTNTINLQEQLLSKDLPLLQRALKEEFSFSIAKGMKNYLCLLRIDNLNEGLFEYIGSSDPNSLKSILSWAAVTRDGSLSDLNFIPDEELWDMVSAESESCLRGKCPHYSRCFYFNARRDMSRSQIIIANHHMFFSDLSIKCATNDNEAGVLPPYNRVVFDEVHNVSDAATSHFGMRVTKYAITKMLKRLKSRGRRGEPKGLIYYAASQSGKLPSELKDSLLSQALLKIEEVLSPRVEETEQAVRDTFDSLYEQIFSVAEECYDDDPSEINIRITEEIEKKDFWSDLKDKFSHVSTKLTTLVFEIGSFLEILAQFEDKADLSKMIVEFRGVYSKLSYYLEVVSAFFNDTSEKNVRWFEGKMVGADISSAIGISPLDVSTILEDSLYHRCKSILMTSATITVNGKFDFIEQQLGLVGNTRLKELMVTSSFNYKDQALIALPEIPQPGSKDYEGGVCSFIKNVINISKGHALVLFTSYSFMNRVYDSIKKCKNLGVMVMKQGDLPRNRLLEVFKSNKGAVLLATNSFWEGIDIPGDTLRMVIITRLPFKVPTDPLIEAKVEYLRKKGKNPFLEYTLPLAVLRFKQGFGRLIRSSTDAGVVVVLDSRILNRFYGRYFLNSLPECKVVKGKGYEILDCIDSFLDCKFKDVEHQKTT